MMCFRFFMFTKPVDTEEVPDYNLIIKQPMDLETMMTKIDMNCYLCAREFLDDIDLICRNALEYNPDRSVAESESDLYEISCRSRKTVIRDLCESISVTEAVIDIVL